MPRPTLEQIEAFYTGLDSGQARSLASTASEAHYEKVLQDERDYPNASVDAARIVATCKRLSGGSRFLDIGAGFGFFSRAAKAQGFETTALEPTLPCQGVFKLMNGFEPIPSMLTGEFVRTHRAAFDVVLMSQVLEHVTDLEPTLRNLSALLAPDGIAAIAVPHFGSWLSRFQGKNDIFIIPPEHLNFFSIAGLEALFQRHGFSRLELHTVSRIDVRRIASRVRIPIVGTLAGHAMMSLLRLSDRVDGGMFINAYFRKDKRP